jgi:hypothetical protein
MQECILCNGDYITFQFLTVNTQEKLLQVVLALFHYATSTYLVFVYCLALLPPRIYIGCNRSAKYLAITGHDIPGILLAE